MSEGLTQEDFRKLLATPRRPNNDEPPLQDNFTSRTPKSAGAVFAKPHSLRRKVFQKKPKENTEEDEEEEQVKDVNYRDRAAERRQQEIEQDESQLTTEELLKRTQKEIDEELNPQQLYEQSKYLGGDVSHTHLVKGLDFALLKKVRSDLIKEEQEPEEMETEDGAPVEIVEEKPQFQNLMAKNIYDLITNEEQQTEKQRVELFERGRMGFVFELADEIGHYSDAFALPTAIIRSKADTDVKSNTADLFAETNLVIEKISQVMTNVRHGERKKTTINKPIPTAMISEPVSMFEDGFTGDIFADVGRDYQLDESALQSSLKSNEEERTEETKKESYFRGLAVDEEEEEDEVMPDAKDTVASILSQAKEEDTQTEQPQKKRKVEDKASSMMDADEADIDMFGLGTSALPTSFDEHSRTAYQSDDEEEEESKTRLVDHGTHRNKKAQLTRWDFETDEEWQKYKDTIEILPKSAIQFGVKMNDGRKRNKEKRSMSDKQRLDRDYQQVKNIMSQKYGKSLDK